MDGKSQVRVDLSLDHAEALALSQLVKRLSWSDARQNAVSDDEAYRMMDAVATLQRALADAGYSPR
ncbi:hypothetical protein [Escherichia coli]|uniref:DUF7706 family protein n=1 Tax=Escherichia coli TaxID=562 RepID=UPI001E4BE38E|nr:hypothetical protein [Escherichia coli]MCC4746023.1 hypothetical protein [Escherichia coli]